MATVSLHTPASGEARHLLLYDGVCGLCDRVVHFVLEHDRRGAFAFAALQSAIGQSIVQRFGGNTTALTTLYVVADFKTAKARMFDRSDAALFIARELGGPWAFAGLFRVLPVAFRNALYNLVARNRYRVFGRFDQCRLPAPDVRARFLDQVPGHSPVQTE